MNKAIGWSVLVALVGIGAAFWYLRKDDSDAEAPATAAAPQSQENQAAINYPIAPAADAEALPSLDESDAAAQSSLEKLFGRQTLAEYLVPKNIIRNAVATIDNLPRKKVAVQLRPLRGTAGAFVTTESAGTLTLSESNYARYQPLVQRVQAADMKQVAGWYRRFYPLFQEAYVGLGYPSGYFNDRLVEVINHLLATPEIHEPIRLTQPNVFYQFADPELEARSAGQKTLLRMGPANIAALKIKLRELRAEITRA